MYVEKAVINYGAPLEVEADDGAMIISRPSPEGNVEITIGVDEFRELIQLARLMQWEDV